MWQVENRLNEGERMEPLDSIYHSTQVEVGSSGDEDEVNLASAAQRIAAWIINRGIEIVLMIPAIVLIVVLIMQNKNGLDDLENMESFFTSMMGGIGLVMVLYLIYGSIQLYFMCKYGQSIGKKLMKIRVVRENGDMAGFVHNVLLREVAYGLICSVIMMVLMGIFVAVFGVEANSGVAMVIDVLLQIVSYLPTLACFIMLFMESRNRQTLQDLLAKTYVVQV